MQMLEGEGWRLVVDPARWPFPVLIGGERWAAELTLAEALALKQAVACLAEQHRRMAEALMAEESITLDLEVETTHLEAAPAGHLQPWTDGSAAACLWLTLEGDSQAWELRFVLTADPHRRGIEGGWSTRASVAFACALEQAAEIGALAEGGSGGGAMRRSGSGWGDQHC
jgi:hypothetical protein